MPIALVVVYTVYIQYRYIHIVPVYVYIISADVKLSIITATSNISMAMVNTPELRKDSSTILQAREKLVDCIPDGLPPIIPDGLPHIIPDGLLPTILRR